MQELRVQGAEESGPHCREENQSRLIAAYRWHSERRPSLFSRTHSGALVASIRAKDDGTVPIVEKGRETPFKQGDYYVFEVADDVARYWNKMDPSRRDELVKRSRKEGKDLRLLVEAYVHKPAHIK